MSRPVLTFSGRDAVPLEERLPDSADVVIVGAGIIGIATAFTLQQAGRRVLVLDRKGVSAETSAGNAGAFAFSDVLPLAGSGVVRKLPRWLCDPLGPLSIDPRYLPAILPWLIRFWRAGWPDRVEASIRAQAALMHLSRAETAHMTRAAGLDHMVHATGSLELYESEREFAASQPGWQARERHGIAFVHLRGTALADRQPGLSRRFVAGTFVPEWQLVDDPFAFACALARAAHARGARFATAEVTGLVPHEHGVEIHLAQGRLQAGQVVVAAGAWSHRLARPLGERIPLDTERGYNTTLARDAFDLRCQLIFGGHGFVISPLASGIRIGGAVELAGLKRAPNFARADAMLEKARRFLPGLDTRDGRQWMGFRPSLPDSLPVIGRARASPRIVHAFGHGHLGLTQSAGTARLVQQLLADETPAVDMAPFSPQRFG